MNFVTVKLLHFVQFNLILFVLFLDKFCVRYCWAHLCPLILRACFHWLSASCFLRNCFFDFEKNFSDEFASMIIILYLKRSGNHMLLLKECPSSTRANLRRPLKVRWIMCTLIFAHNGFTILNTWVCLLHRRSFIGWPLTHVTSSLNCVIIWLSIAFGIMYCTLKSTTIFFSVMSHIFFKLL